MKTQEQIFKASKKEKTLGSPLFKKDGTMHANVKNAIDRAKFVDNKLYHTRTTGSGRYISIQSDYVYFERMLKLAGCKFSVGNDAPRGGKCGDYIRCSKKAINLILSLR